VSRARGTTEPRVATVVRSGRLPPAVNMATDEAALRATPDLPSLRLYGWSPPGLSLGHFQDEREASAALAAFPRAVVVRRPTGGGAIYHDDEVTYALVLPLADPLLAGAGLAESYRRLDAPILAALAALGVDARHRSTMSQRSQTPMSQRSRTLSQRSRTPASGGRRSWEPFYCFDRASRLDVVADDSDGAPRKIAGSAQRRSRTHLLQHGSVLLSAPLAISGAIGVNDALAARGEAPVGFDALAAALERAFAEVLGLRFD